jgi:tetratricopeptide (TPR) repeat protein
VLSQVIERDKAGQILPEYTRARYAVHYVLGMLDAGRGRPTAEAHAVELARDRSYRVNAWRVRALLNLARGDLKEAADCRRRAELAVLREGMGQLFPETTAFNELQCYALCDDLNGVHQTTQSIAQLASRFAGWRQFLVLGQCHELRLQGDAAGGLSLLEPMLREVQPGVHASYACLAACHLQLLCDANRIPEAVQHAATHLAAYEREQLSSAGLVTLVAAADAFAKNLEFERAVEILERALTLGHELGHGGVCIGNIYEARARVAFAMGDTPHFEHYATLCASAYGHARNPHLAVKLARLAGLKPGLSDSLLPSASLPMEGGAAARDEYATLHSRMLECVDEADRARCALTILLQELASFCGYLYGVNEGAGCALLAKVPEGDVDPALGTWITQLVAAETQPREDSTGHVSTDTGGDTSTDAVSFRFTDASGRNFEPLFLIRRFDDQERMAAVLIFEASRSGHRRPSRELQEDLADQLLSHGDVRGAPMPVDDLSARTR